MNASPLSRVPALRILLPFAAGIMLNASLPGFIPVIVLAVLGVAFYVTLRQLGREPLKQLQVRPWWIVPVALLSMSAGALSLQLSRPTPIELRNVNGKVLTGLIESIESYDFSMRMQVRLSQVDSQPANPQRVLITTQGCDYSIHEGDLVSFRGNLAPITNLGNPDEFDRQSYLWQQGILYGQHLPVNQLRRVGHRPTLMSRSASLRQHLIERVLNTSLSQPCQDLLIALLLGDDRLIDPGVREKFSMAGIAHILALSGLHVGLIASLIWFLLFPLDYLRLKKLRLVITLVVLAGFAWLTAMSPSVVRATIMIGFTLVAMVLYRQSLALNAMCLSALLTLCIWPTALYQAGFQLSYITVAAIVGLQDRVFPARVDRKRRLRHRLSSLISTSLIAMAATIMLTAYYFNAVSLLSVLSNVLILPVMPVLMVLAVIFLFLAAIGLECSALNASLDTLYTYMSNVTHCVASLPGAHLSGVYVTGATVGLFYALLACLVMAIITQRPRWRLRMMGITVLVAGQLAYVKLNTPSQTLIILNDHRSTPILWHDNGKTYAWLPDTPDADRTLFEHTHRRLLAHLGSDSLQWVTDTLRDQRSLVHQPLAILQGKRILVAGKGVNKTYLQHAHRIGPVHLLVVTKRYHGTIQDIVNQCPCGLVILSGALTDDRYEAYLHECRLLGLKYHDTKQAGAWMLQPIK